MAKLTSKPKKKTVNSDVFKIRKAKVGKRAPQKLNTTDTSFKTSQLRLRDQNSSTNNNTVDGNNVESPRLSSQQGKTIATLTTQLAHPSPVVRKSGLRGIKNIIDRMDNNGTTTTTASSSSIRSVVGQQLSLILPPLGQSLLDADDAVRSLGSLCLRTLLRRTRRRGGGSSSSAMAPFLELLMAYLSSCLNSLDEDVRYDGVDVLHDLLVGLGRNDNGGVVELLGNKLLPCFVSLLSSSRGRAGGNGRKESETTTTTTIGNTKKRKRREAKKNGKGDATGGGSNALPPSTSTISRRCRVLRALVSLLRASAPVVDDDDDDDGNETTDGDDGDDDDWVIPQLDLIWGEEDSSLPYGILPLVDDDDTRRRRRRNNPSSTPPPHDPTIQLTLLSKLRDSWLELSQRGTKHGRGLALPSRLLDEAHSIIRCALHLRSTMRCDNKLSKMERSVVATFLETFPLRDESSSSRVMTGEGEGGGGVTYESVNAAYCALLSRYCGTSSTSRSKDENNYRSGGSEETTTSNNNDKSFWVDKVLNYAIPQLKHLIDGSGGASTSVCSSAVTLVSVLQPLLCSSTMLTNETARLRLLDTFRHVFFSSEEEEEEDNDDVDDNHEEDAATRRMRRSMVRRSPVGHRAALVLSRLIRGHYNNGIMTTTVGSSGDLARSTNDDEWNHCLSRMILSIPSFLGDVSNVSPSSSYALLESLLFVAKRWNPLTKSSTTVQKDDDDNKRRGYELDDIVQRLRHDISIIFSTPRDNNNNNSSPRKRRRRQQQQTTLSIFERYPPPVQRLSLSLIGMLSQPSPSLLSSLAAIAKRSSIAAATSDTTTTLPSLDDGRKEETESSSSPPRKKRRTTNPTAPPRNDTDAIIIISSSIVDYLFDVIHTTRKTTKMGHYLTFLVDAVGFPPSNSTSSETTSSLVVAKRRRQRALAYDEGIRRTCRFVTNSIVDGNGRGGKIMTMLTPVLSSWIETVGGTRRRRGSSFVELRAALVILSRSLSCCRVDDGGGEDEGEGMVVSNLMTKTTLVEAIITFWMSLTWNGASATNDRAGNGEDAEGDEMEERDMTIQLLEPIATLMTRHSPLCQKLLRAIIPTIQQQQSDNDDDDDDDNKKYEQQATRSKQSSTSPPVDTITTAADERQTTENIITAMTILFKSFPSLKDALRRNDESSRLLRELVSTIETMVEGGSLDRLGGLLKMDVFLFLGCKMGDVV